MIKTWSFCDSATGALLGRTFSGSESALAANTPEGAMAVEGVHDHMSCRVDTATGEVVDYVPPQPAADDKRTWAWDTGTRRWVETKTLLGEQERVVATIQRGFEPLMSMQARPVREIAVATAKGVAPLEESVTRIQQIEDRAAALRQLQRDALATANRRDLLAVENAARALLDAPV
jgi:hypothetical protein